MSKRPRCAVAHTQTYATNTPMYQASSVRSGNVVAFGLHANASIHCAGMALFRVFQGHADVLGWSPALGTYYPLYSPKWNSLLVINGRFRSDANESITTIDAEYQAPFTTASKELFTAQNPRLSLTLDLDEEHEADKLARDIGETYPIVLIFHKIPVTVGNLMNFYAPPMSTSAITDQKNVMLPGFKIIVNRDQFELLESATVDKSTFENNHLKSLLVLDPSRTIHLSHGWISTITNIERAIRIQVTPSSQRIVVCGGKDVGKSTFCRFVVNRLLAIHDVVAFLDTDLGQPELTPPGMVSLHALTGPLLGPGFTHMKNPLRSFFCGATNPGTDPLFYMKAVTALLELYERKWGQRLGESTRQVVPLVINTDGWVKSMGHDLLCQVIMQANPQHVVQLISTTKSKQFIVPTAKDARWQVHCVDPWNPDTASSAQPPRGSKEMRLFRLHSYFVSEKICHLSTTQLQNIHAMSEKDQLYQEFARAYGEVCPFMVSFDAVDVCFAGASVPPSHVLLSLQCSIVGLCVNRHREAIVPAENADRSHQPPRIQLKAVHSPCLGVGIVRGIDAARRLFFILSPLPKEMMQHVNLLVRGNISVDALFHGQVGAGSMYTPYVVTDVVASEGTGSSTMQSRNNIKRKRDGDIRASNKG